jgi:hypothetical protein
MKKLILGTTFLVAGSFSLLAQGMCDFSNQPWEAWPAGTENKDRLVYMGGTPGAFVDPIADPTWSAQLVQYVGGSWEKLGTPQPFYGAGLEGIWAYDGTKLNVTAAPVDVGGKLQNVAVEIYNGTGGFVARSPGFVYTKANSSPPSPTDTLMVNFSAFAVPEPSTIALGVLGLGALLLFRRRQ